MPTTIHIEDFPIKAAIEGTRLIRPPWYRDKLDVITVGRIIRWPPILYKCTFQPLKTIILSKRFLEDINLPKQPII